MAEKSQFLPDNKSWKQQKKHIQKENLNFTAHDASKWHMLLKKNQMNMHKLPDSRGMGWIMDIF